LFSFVAELLSGFLKPYEISDSFTFCLLSGIWLVSGFCSFFIELFYYIFLDFKLPKSVDDPFFNDFYKFNDFYSCFITVV
jgi:hypothetical protein